MQNLKRVGSVKILICLLMQNLKRAGSVKIFLCLFVFAEFNRKQNAVLLFQYRNNKIKKFNFVRKIMSVD